MRNRLVRRTAVAVLLVAASALLSLTVTMSSDVKAVAGMIPAGAGRHPGLVAEQSEPRTPEFSAPPIDMVQIAERSPGGEGLAITSAVVAPSTTGPPSPPGGTLNPIDEQGGGSTFTLLVVGLVGLGIVVGLIVWLSLRRRAPQRSEGIGGAEGADH